MQLKLDKMEEDTSKKNHKREWGYTTGPKLTSLEDVRRNVSGRIIPERNKYQRLEKVSLENGKL